MLELNPIFDETFAPIFNLCDVSSDERPGDDDGRGAGVRDPADHYWQAALRPGGQDHWPSGSLVLWSTVHRF